ncbi:MAG: response regulator [Pseudomonadota bacterium]
MERILLVEDEVTNRRILSAYLQRAGYDVDEAEDGLAALGKLKSQNYDLVVTDWRMPNMDGLELAKRLKADAKLRHIPILMQTAADSPEEVVEGMRAGVYYYLTKPYEENMLLALVRAGLRERKQKEWFEERSARQRDALGTFVKGEFHLQTPEEAQGLAFGLGNRFPNPELAVSGLYELLLNAIEHGNLGIGFEEKRKLLAARQWEEEVEKRLKNPENARKKVIVLFSDQNGKMETTVIDQGSGFDWRPFLEIEPARATQANGRGIAKANLLGFDELAYKGNGNQVTVASMRANP